MAFTTFEFPNASYYNDDLRELVRLYHELKNTYDSLQDEIQKVLDYIDNFKDIVDETVREQLEIIMSLYTQRLIEVEKKIEQLENNVDLFDARITKNTQDILKLQSDIKSLTNYFNNLHQELLEEFHNYKNSVGKYVDGKVVELERYIKETVTKLDRLDVVNPITHIFEDINKVLEELFELTQASFGITAEEYDKLMLTAWEYDYQRIKAIDYTTKGWFIFWELRQGLMTNPFDGLKTHYSNIIHKLADLHKCTFTAKQFDELECTAIDYDSWVINAFNYDWFGRQFILKREGITAENYDEKKWSAEKYDNEKVTAYRYDNYGNAILKYNEVTTSKCMSCNPDVLKPILEEV